MPIDQNTKVTRRVTWSNEFLSPAVVDGIGPQIAETTGLRPAPGRRLLIYSRGLLHCQRGGSYDGRLTRRCNAAVIGRHSEQL